MFKPHSFMFILTCGFYKFMSFSVCRSQKHILTSVRQAGYIQSHNLILASMSTVWLDFMFYWIYCVSSKITLLFLSLTPVFLFFSSRWRRRWGRREIPRCRPPSALPIPIPLSRGPLPPPAPLLGTCHGHLPPEPPPEEDALWPRHNFTCRCVWLLREALSLNAFLLCFFSCVPWCRSCYCSNETAAKCWTH